MTSTFWPGLTEALVQLLLPPFFFLLSLVIFLASFGKSLGVRRLYVRVLLMVFEVTATTFMSVAVRNSSVAPREEVTYCILLTFQFAGNIAKEDQSKLRRSSRTFYMDSSEESDSDESSNDSPIKKVCSARGQGVPLNRV